MPFKKSSSASNRTLFTVYETFEGIEGAILGAADSTASQFSSAFRNLPWYPEGKKQIVVDTGAAVVTDNSSHALWVHGGKGSTGSPYKTIKSRLQVRTPSANDNIGVGFDYFIRLNESFENGSGVVVRIKWTATATVEAVQVEYRSGPGDGPWGNQGLGGQVLKAATTVTDITDLTSAPLQITIEDDGSTITTTIEGSEESVSLATDFSTTLNGAVYPTGTFGVDWHGSAATAQAALVDFMVIDA